MAFFKKIKRTRVICYTNSFIPHSGGQPGKPNDFTKFIAHSTIYAAKKAWKSPYVQVPVKTYVASLAAEILPKAHGVLLQNGPWEAGQFVWQATTTGNFNSYKYKVHKRAILNKRNGLAAISLSAADHLESVELHRRIRILLIICFLVIFITTFISLLNEGLEKQPEIKNQFYEIYVKYIFPYKSLCSFVNDEVFSLEINYD